MKRKKLIQLKIHVVEDNKIFLHTLKAKLNQSFVSQALIKGYSDSNTFLEELSEKPEIIIMDYYLGSESTFQGKELIQMIKITNPKAFLIVLTSEENLFIARECFELGANSYLVKSIASIDKIVADIHYKIDLFNSKTET